MKVLTTDELGEFDCARPDHSQCNHEGFYLHAECHRGAQLEVAYHVPSGVLVLLCGVCSQPVCRIAVKEGTRRTN